MIIQDHAELKQTINLT